MAKWIKYRGTLPTQQGGNNGGFINLDHVTNFTVDEVYTTGGYQPEPSGVFQVTMNTVGGTGLLDDDYASESAAFDAIRSIVGDVAPVAPPSNIIE